MNEFERAIRNMSEQGQVGACVPAAFKDAGIEVGPELFIQAAFSGAMDPIRVASELGLQEEKIAGITLERLFADFDRMKKEGIYSFLRIGRPSELRIIPQHINAVLSKAELNRHKTLTLGGIPPFGNEAGMTFELEVLKKVVPEENGILIFRR